MTPEQIERRQQKKKEQEARAKLKRLVYVILILILVVAVATGAVIYFTAQQATIPDIEQNFTMENFVDRDVEEVREILEHYNIMVIVSEEYNEEHERGRVIFQSIPAGEVLEYNPDPLFRHQVDLLVSRGSNRVVIPGLRGRTLDYAETRLQELGVNYVLEEEFSNVVTGSVIRTEPAAQEIVVLGDTVTIFISKGREPREPRLVAVPDLLGMDKERAITLLQNRRLSVGQIFVGGYPHDPNDTVTSQNPLPGTYINEHRTVSIYLSNFRNNANRSIHTRRFYLQGAVDLPGTVQLSIRATYSDTGETKYIVRDLSVARERLNPFMFQVEIPHNGYTNCEILFDGELYIVRREMHE